MSTTAILNNTMNEGAEGKRHTLSLHVANKPGVLIRISLVFARRGYNIDSLVVSPTNDPRFSTMNIACSGDEKTLDQILKQLNKLVDVVHARDCTDMEVIHRELALMKVRCNDENRGSILLLAHSLGCDTVDLGSHSVTFEVSGDSEKLDGISKVFEQYGVEEMIRTGKVLIARGDVHTS